MLPTTLDGALVALVTPLTADRTLDPSGVAAVVTRARAEGIAGVLVAGTTGEGALLEPADRVALVRAARAAAADGTVLAGASAPTLAGLHDDVARLHDAGADVVLVLAPATYPLTADELAEVHLEVAERAAGPTLAYHIPQLTGSALTVDALARLAAHPRVVGIKDSSPDADRRAAFVGATREQDGFAVLTGHAPTLARALRDGAAGSITAIANLRPRQVAALHAAVAAGADAEVARLQRALAELSEHLAAVEGSMAAVLKAALQLDGVLDERWCVPPLSSVPGRHLDRVRTALLR